MVSVVGSIAFVSQKILLLVIQSLEIAPANLATILTGNLVFLQFFES